MGVLGVAERVVAGVVCAMALAAFACGDDGTQTLTLGHPSSQGGDGQGGLLLPDGGYAGTSGGGLGADTCAAGGSLCGGVCVNTTTDMNNCGSCGAVCTGACALGRCVVTLAPGAGAGAGAIAVDATHVYYVGGGALMSVPLAGGTPVTLAPTAQGGIAVNATDVYYFNPSALMSVPLAGGTPTEVANGSGQAVVMTAKGLCWTTTDGDVLSLPLEESTAASDGGADGGEVDGGIKPLVAPRTLASNQGDTVGMAVDATNLYWTTSGTLSGGGGFAPLTGTVMSLTFGGGGGGGGGDGGVDGGSGPGPATTLASGQNYPFGLTLDTTSVYWTAAGTSANNYTDGAVMRAPMGGGAATPLAAGQSSPYGIAVDGTSVYWTNSGKAGNGGSVMSVPVGGGTAVTLATGQAGPASLVVDATSAYWTTGTGAVMRATPK